MVKVTVSLTPDEFRKMLHEPFDKIYDALVESLQNNGFGEKEAKGICAHYFLEYIKSE